MSDTISTGLISNETLFIIRGVLPSFAIAFIGFMLGKWDRNLHMKTVSNMIYYVFSPCLIFSSLHRRAFDFQEFATIGAAVTILILVMLPVTCVYMRAAKIRERGFYLPVIFMSTGTIALPIALLLYGNEGLAKAILFHMFNILFLYSLGIFLVSGQTNVKQFLKIPALYATILGVLAASSPLSVPGELQQFVWLAERGVDLVGMGAIPMLIISFGYSLNSVKLSDLKEGFGGAGLRVILGPALAFAVVYLFREFGWMPTEKGYDLLKYLDLRTTEAVIILMAAMPGPIMSYMLNAKFNSCPQKAASILAVGTLAGVITIPLVLHLTTRFIFG